MKKYYSLDSTFKYRHSGAVPYNRAKTKKFEGTRLGFSKYPSDIWDDYTYSPKKLQRFARRTLEKYNGQPAALAEHSLSKTLNWSAGEIQRYLREWFGAWTKDGAVYCKPHKARRKNEPEFSEDQIRWNLEHDPKNLDKAVRQSQAVLGKYWYAYRNDDRSWAVSFGTVHHQEPPKGDWCCCTDFKLKRERFNKNWRSVYVPGLHLYYEGVTLEPHVKI